MTIEEIQKVAKAAGFKWRQCSDCHWQMLGGTELLNVYSGKRGFTIYVPGMPKGQLVLHMGHITDAIKEIKGSAKGAKSAGQSQPVVVQQPVAAVAEQKPPAEVVRVDKLAVFDAPLSQVETVTAGLLTCPFCGGAPEERPDRKYPELIRIACTGCDATSCPYGLQHKKSDAVDDWNTRVIAGEKTTFRFERSEEHGEHWTATTPQQSYGPFPLLKTLLATIFADKKKR